MRRLRLLQRRDLGRRDVVELDPGRPPLPIAAHQSPAIVLRRSMANIASQKKRIARSERERVENLRFRSSVKTHFKRLEAAVQSGNADAVASEHKSLISRIDKAVQKGALHRNTGARKKSRAAGIAGSVSK